MTRRITAAVVQFPVSLDVDRNCEALLSLLRTAPGDSLVVTPEGAISGYEPGPGFLERLDAVEIESGIDRVHAHSAARGQCVCLGACVPRPGGWRNAVILLQPDGARSEYWKINLAHTERVAFEAGANLPVFDVSLAGLAFKLGIQMCREIRHPEQWRHLAVAGAEVLAFANNAIGDSTIAPIWRSHLISRAAELQRFVVAANNAARDQKCPTIIVGPDGRALCEKLSAETAIGLAELDLDEVSDWVINQSRSDMVFRR